MGESKEGGKKAHPGSQKVGRKKVCGRAVTARPIRNNNNRRGKESII